MTIILNPPRPGQAQRLLLHLRDFNDNAPLKERQIEEPRVLPELKFVAEARKAAMKKRMEDEP